MTLKPPLPLRMASRMKLIISVLANVGVSINFSSIEIAVLLMRHGQRLETSWTMSILDSLVFLGCIFGMLTFGYVGDVLGRIAGLRLTMIVAIAGILASLSPLKSPKQLEVTLMLSRFVVGVGCGGCYPLSAALAYERESDGKLAEVSVAVANFGQPLGSILLNIAALALFWTSCMSSAAVWRAVLLMGGLPFVIALVLMFGLRETTPRGLGKGAAADALLRSEGDHESLAQVLPTQLRVALAGASLTWFCYNSYAYGIITFYPQLAAAILGQKTLAVLLSNLAAGAAAVVVAVVSLAHIHRSGARASVIFSSGMSAVYTAAICAFYQIGSTNSAMKNVFLWLFIALRGLVQWPGIGVFTIPNTIFEARIRARTHGVASAIGKIGAIVGSATYPLALCDKQNGFLLVLLMTTLACAATSCVCAALIPEDPDAFPSPPHVSESKLQSLSVSNAGQSLRNAMQRLLSRLMAALSPSRSSHSLPARQRYVRHYSELDPLLDVSRDYDEKAGST